MKISIIIPVYNGEMYIERCLNSILNQSIGFESLEIIIINDGSKDKSEEIVKRYIIKHKNIKYFYQENKGQAFARNVGLKHVTGDFVTFIDCDDTIDEKMLEKLYIESMTGNFDIVTCDLSKVKNNKIINISSRICKNDISNYILTKTGPCNMLIKAQFLKECNFNFPENLKKYEDIAVTPVLGLKNNVKIKHIDECLYFYYDNDDSVMNNTKYTKKMHDIFISMNYLLKNAKKEKNYNIYKEEIEYLFIRHLIMSAGLRYARFDDPENKIKEIKKYMKVNFPNWKRNRYFRKSSFKYKMTAYLVIKNKKRVIRFLDKAMKK